MLDHIYHKSEDIPMRSLIIMIKVQALQLRGGAHVSGDIPEWASVVPEASDNLRVCLSCFLLGVLVVTHWPFLSHGNSI